MSWSASSRWGLALSILMPEASAVADGVAELINHDDEDVGWLSVRLLVSGPIAGARQPHEVYREHVLTLGLAGIDRANFIDETVGHAWQDPYRRAALPGEIRSRMVDRWQRTLTAGERGSGS